MFSQDIEPLSGTWILVGGQDELSQALLEAPEDTRLFFVHWSVKVPDEITRRFECINFHMTDLPYGQGGSPLQHLILRGHEETVMSALRMTSEIDAGPIYLKRRLALHGSAEAIYVRAARLAATMIEEISSSDIEPTPQLGEPVRFRRRTPRQSEMPSELTVNSAFDFIRMLDAEGYPLAFVDYGSLRFRFRRAVLYSNRVEADVEIVDRPEAST